LGTRGPNNSAQVFDRQTGREVRRFEGHSKPITAVGISRDGKQLITGSQDLTVRIWDVETGKELRQFEVGSDRDVRSVAISPDNRYLVAGTFDKKTHAWDLQTGQLLHTREGTGMATSSQFVDNTNALICSGPDVILWNVETGKDSKQFTHPHSAVCVDVSPDRKRMLVGTRGNTLWLWDLETAKVIRRFDSHKEMVRCVAFSPDGKWGVSGSYDNTIILWDLATGKIRARLLGHEKQILSIHVSPDGRFAVSGGADYSVRLWDLSSISQESTAGQVMGWMPAESLPTHDLILQGEVGEHKNGAWFVRYSPDGKTVATGGGDGLIWLWDSTTHKKLVELSGHKGSVRCGEFSPDGKLLATGGADKTIKLWNVSQGKLIATYTGHD
ncbi:MAG: WD40 repeat domain-containing protein, partial [Planctomycetaceae bacterium]|nr:WD40 repeat domain-containing protein [Planctomycetaceae bacterium]